MVIHVGALKSGDLESVHTDIGQITALAHSAGAIVKVILETGLLTDEEKMQGCVLACLAGADFVKTSTGFGPSGATPGDVALLRRVVGDALGVKAAGGIRSFASLQSMMAAGASRIGTSASVAILQQSLTTVS
jgi:deoxyribose-phosphate aldolase